MLLIGFDTMLERSSVGDRHGLLTKMDMSIPVTTDMDVLVESGHTGLDICNWSFNCLNVMCVLTIKMRNVCSLITDHLTCACY